MSGAAIDVTARARIRALAARMHRARIAGVFSTGGGVLAVDEGQLDADQRAEATRILDEAASAALEVKDVEVASRAAAMVSHYVRPSCSTCHGGGLVRRGGVDDICACVDRRWQADVDRRAHADGFRASGRAFDARVEGARAVDREERIAAATDSLARARAAASAACADLDARIVALEASSYFAERGQLNASSAESRVLAEDHERQAHARATAVAEARVRVEEILIRIGQSIEPLFEARSIGSVAQARASLDEAHAIAAAAGGLCADQEWEEEAARQARADERLCEQRIEALDADNAPLVAEIERLRTEHVRVARHYQSKVDRTERRLRRLVYVSGGTGESLAAEDPR